ncbi:hypothetical protein BC332_02186 [Capsicum chinense]|nr:hypothetical protein BC332_02186 [Capsicum chinense]
MRQFEQIQHIPEAPEWQPDRVKHDDPSPVDLDFILDHNHCVDIWINWQPRVVEAYNDASLNTYLEWYFLHGRLLVGNPTSEVLGTSQLRLHMRQFVEACNDCIFDQANLAFHGPAVLNEQYQEPLEMHGGGRGGRGYGRGELQSQILRQRQMMTQLDSMSQFITISFCSSLVVTYISHSLTIEVPVCWDSLVKLFSWFYSGELPRPISGCLWDNPNKKEKLHE